MQHQAMSVWRIGPSHIRVLLTRWTSSKIPSKIHLQKPPNEAGYFSYSRNVSRDPGISADKKPLQGDTPKTFMLRRLGHAYEVYPLIGLATALITILVSTAYYSFTKIEVWLDRRQGMKAPWDWERSRDDYWKKGTVAFDLDGRTRKRCEMMEVLQDEMLAAAKKRGTR